MKVTGLNVFFEQHREQEDAVAAGAERSRSVAESTGRRIDMAHHDNLYELLNNRANCEIPDHGAFLLLP